MLAQKIAREFGTPAVVIDLDRVERNIARVQAACEAAGVANRPHIKTHKSPVIAEMQRDGGAHGITCQKIGEAEVMAEAGLDDILISYNLLGEEKMARLAGHGAAEVTVAADNPTVSPACRGRPRSRAGPRRRRRCDTGRKRAGVETPPEAIALARDIAARPGLSFAGLMLYPPEDAMEVTQKFLDEALAGLRETGLEARMVSTGGTPNVAHLGGIKGATEHRAGTYVFNDRMMLPAAPPAGRSAPFTSSRRGQPRRPGARHPRRRLEDADLRHRRRSTATASSSSIPRPIAQFAEEHGFLDLRDATTGRRSATSSASSRTTSASS